MINLNDIMETINMISEENLDIRTVTMGISLLDCADSDIDKACEKVYNKITRLAGNLVKVGEDIEKEYGVLLFARVNKRLRLTETGREFLPYAKRVLALEKEVDEFLRNAADMTRIRIGTSVTVGTCLMPRLGGELSFRVPGIRLEVVVNNTKSIENQLLNGELDIGLVEGDINHSDLLINFAKYRILVLD